MGADGYGQAFEGVARLAMAGIAAMTSLAVVTVIGLACGAWWLWHHVSVAVH